MMKIGIVCYPTYGGSGVLATELGMALAHKGYEVHFITYNQPVRLDFISSGLHFHQVKIEEYPLFEYQPYELALSSKMARIVAKYGLDILHVHYAIPHAYAAYMAKKMLHEKGIEVKVVTTLHGTDITLVGSHPSYKTAVEFSINHSDAVTAVSKSLKQQTLDLFQIHKPIDVIYNFIDVEKYTDKNFQDFDRSKIVESADFVLTHVSNFRPVKRVFDVLEVFYRVQKKRPSKLVLVGEGPELINVRKRAKALKIYDKILFLGNSVELPEILSCSDLFLLPSETESFGLAALEAMMAKTPVVSSRSGGLPEVNIHGKTGYLSPVGDVEDMAKNALRILEDPARLEGFKNAAREHASRFSIQAILPQYEAVYKRLFSS